MKPEPRGSEGAGYSHRRRWKNGLETPLVGRYVGEKWLVFAPPIWYDILTWCCMVCGVWAFGSVFVSSLQFGVGGILPGAVNIWFGPALFVAGLWAQLSSERMRIQVQNRSYVRREGQGAFKRVTHGSMKDVDAIVLIAEPYAANPGMVVYRAVMYWKGQKEPPLVIEQAYVHIGVGSALQSGNGVILKKSAEHARRLGVSFYDNSYFASPAPLKPV